MPHLEVAEAKVSAVLEDAAPEGAAEGEVLRPEVVEIQAANIYFVWWDQIALPTPEIVKRDASNYRRGRAYEFDDETLDALSSLPQPPDDDYPVE